MHIDNFKKLPSNEQKDLLVSYVIEGNRSYLNIAAEMRCTRSMIAGLCYRFNIKKTQAQKAKRPVVVKDRNNNPIIVVKRRVMPIVAPRPVRVGPVETGETTLLTAGPHQCRWIVHDHTMCGRYAERLPYCPEHRARAYIPWERKNGKATRVQDNPASTPSSS